jgi:beta-lactamase regulating signal transducer with metallopeptidase domain
MAPHPRLFPSSHEHQPPTDSLNDRASFPNLAADLAIETRPAWDFSNGLAVLSKLWPARALPIRVALPATLAIGITLAWLLLAVVRLGCLGWQCLALQRLKRQHQPVPAPIQDQCSELCREMNVRRAVQLGVVPDLRSPIAIGFFHPIILLPEALVGSTHADLDPMLRHELAHVQRRDDWTNLVQQVVKAVFFFHPGVIALSRRLNLDREIACDDHVLAATRTPRDYALFLTDFASRTQGRQWAAAPAAWSNPNQLRERIHMILDPKRNTSPRMAPMRTGILTLAALLIAATGIGAAPRLALDATEAPSATTLASTSVDTDVSTDVLIVEEITEPETLLVGLDAVRVEVTTSDSDDDELDRPKEKPARTTGSSSRSSDSNKNENRNSRVIIRSSGGATSIAPGDKQRTLVLEAPSPAPHPEPAPHLDARPVPRPPKPAKIAVESRTATVASTEERSLEERMRRLEKLVDSLARKPQEMYWSAPKHNFHFEDLAKSMDQVSKDVERSMRDAERKVREAHERNNELAREKAAVFSAEGADKAQQAQRRAIAMQRQALRRQIESMESQVERLEDQLERLDDQFEAAVEAEAEAKEKAKAAKEKQKDKSKPRHPDARPEQDPAAPTVQETTPPTPPAPGALIRN